MLALSVGKKPSLSWRNTMKNHPSAIKDSLIPKIEGFIREGFSAQKIANALYVTRGIVVGFCFRRGIKLNHYHPKQKTEKKEKNLRFGIFGLKSNNSQPLPPEKLHDSAGVQFPPPDGYCRNIRGNALRKPYALCCGLLCEVGKSYCPDCCKTLYQPYQPRRM